MITYGDNIKFFQLIYQVARRQILSDSSENFVIYIVIQFSTAHNFIHFIIYNIF